MGVLGRILVSILDLELAGCTGPLRQLRSCPLLATPVPSVPPKRSERDFDARRDQRRCGFHNLLCKFCIRLSNLLFGASSPSLEVELTVASWEEMMQCCCGQQFLRR